MTVRVHSCGLNDLLKDGFGVCLNCGELHVRVSPDVPPAACDECGARTVVDLVRGIEFGAIVVEGQLAA